MTVGKTNSYAMHIFAKRAVFHFASCAECPFLRVISPNASSAGMATCAAKCSQHGLRLAVIESESQYRCALREKRNSTVAVWTGMTVSSTGIWDQYGGKTLSNFAEMRFNGSSGTMSNKGQLTGPIYLQNKAYVLSTITSKIDNIKCLCQPGRSKIKNFRLSLSFSHFE